MPRRLPLLLLLALLAFLPGCRFGNSAPERQGYTLVLLKTGAKPEPPDAESQKLFEGHFANMMRLAKEKKLLLAGPYGKPKHDPALRGLFVLDTSDPAQAKAWAETDPCFQAGIFTLEYRALSTQAALHALLAQELARVAAEEAAGEHPAPGANVRPYVILHAARGAEMERELAGQEYVLLRGRVDGGGGWAILAAQTPEEALELVGASRERMGDVAVDAWYATKGLEKLPTLVDG